MSRSVSSEVGLGSTSRFNPINLVKRFTIIAVVSAMALVGSTAIAGAASSRALNPLSAPTVVAHSSSAVATYVSTATAGTGTTAPTSITIVATPGGATCTITLSASNNCTLTGLTNGTAYTATEAPSANDTVDTISGASASFTPIAQLPTPSAVNDGTTGVNVTFAADGIDTLYTVTAYLSSAVTPGTLPGAATTQGTACIIQNTTTPPTGNQICAVTNLLSGTSYDFVVTPTNASPANSQSYASAALVVSTALAAPTAVDNGSGSAIVSFSADDSATSYVVTSTPASAGCSVTGTTAPTGNQTCTVNGLTNGTSYTFVVTPSGGSTTSTVSPASAGLVIGHLLTPTAVDAGVGAATVTFTADGAATTYLVNSYTVTGLGTLASPYVDGAVTAFSCTIAVTSPVLTGSQNCTVTGLTAGTLYAFTVTPSGGTTSSLISGYSAPVKVVTPLALATPTAAVYSGSGTATVSFVADGVSTTYTVKAQTVTGSSAPYTYTASALSCTDVYTVAPTGTLSCVVTGLTLGTSYAFTVTPSGTATTDVTSVESNTIVPGAVLATPTAAASGPDAITVSFVADGVGTTDTVTATGGSNPTCVFVDTVAPPTGAHTCTFTGLTAGVSYTFVLTSTGNGDTIGASAASNAVIATLRLGTPVVANAGTGTIGVTFTADGVASTNTVDAYLASAVLPGAATAGAAVVQGACVVANSTTPPSGSVNCKVVGLNNGVAYTFIVTPSNGGSSQNSLASASIVPGVAPLATPTVAIAGSGAVKVTFAADGVASTYVATSTPGGLSCTIANSSVAPTGSQNCTVTGLTNGTAYTFVVTPSGNGTSSAPSLASAPIVPTALTAPTGLATVSTATTIAVTWVAATNVGGTPISGYVVTAVAGNTTVSCGAILATATTCTLTGLTANTTYTVNVTADTSTATATASTSATTSKVVVSGPHTTGTHGSAVVGKTVTITISGGGFTGQPKVTSSAAGVKATVSKDSGKLLTLRVTVPANGAKGEHTFTLHFSNGKIAKANYATV